MALRRQRGFGTFVPFLGSPPWGREREPHPYCLSATKEAGVNSSELGKAILGIAAWAAVAVFALIAVENWDPLWGFFPVLAAVLAAWAVGEYVMRGEAGDQGGGQ
jgi:hypothetical protein